MTKTRTRRTTTYRVPPVVQYGTFVLCLIGAALGLYLTVAHYQDPKLLACPDTGIVNCAKVTSSDQSFLFGVPVALLGLLFFLGMTGLCLPVAWRRGNAAVTTLRLVGAVTGLGMVAWLVYAELVILDAICLYCTAVHAVTVILFFMVVFGTALRERVSGR